MFRLENSGSDCKMGSGLRGNGFNSACTVELLSEWEVFEASQFSVRYYYIFWFFNQGGTMKTLLALSLVIYFQTATAGCPTREMIEFTYMTKDELIGFYCINKHHWTEDREKHDKWDNNFNEDRAGGSYSDSKESLKIMALHLIEWVTFI
jgi:hypothetical protein